MPQLQVEEFVLTGAPEYGCLKQVFKRYRSPYARIPKEQKLASGTALVFMHCIATHKETWEPTIENIFEYQFNGAGNSKVNVVEAWSMDSQNHGHAASLNEDFLLKNPKIIDATSCADGLEQLLASGLISGDKVVGIGHSAGAAVTILSAAKYPLTRLPYSSIILVEPAMMTRPILNKMLKSSESGVSPIKMVMTGVQTRKDVWPSREEAHQWFAKRYPWKQWDPRILKLYIENALRDLPTGTYPDQQTGVTLACPRSQEILGYLDFEGAIRSLELLSVYCPIIPVHCIIGNRPDLVADETREGIWDANEGRRMASIMTVEGAGHLVAQENPEGVAYAMWTILEREATASATTVRRESRL